LSGSVLSTEGIAGLPRLEIRLPHALLLLLTGAALAGSGAGYQGLFRNPLADPYLIGSPGGLPRSSR
jgi:iron complex transport system permease protein